MDRGLTAGRSLRRRATERVLVLPVWLWIRFQRWRLRPGGRALSEEERDALAEHVAVDLLARVRVVERQVGLGPVTSGLARAVGLGGMVMRPRGMALVDVIVVAPGGHSTSLLFHEMVHVVQYRKHGVWAFSRAYVRGFFEGGYMGIGLEREAYELQARFDAGERFDTASEIHPIAGR